MYIRNENGLDGIELSVYELSSKVLAHYLIIPGIPIEGIYTHLLTPPPVIQCLLSPNMLRTNIYIYIEHFQTRYSKYLLTFFAFVLLFCLFFDLNFVLNSTSTMWKLASVCVYTLLSIPAFYIRSIQRIGLYSIDISCLLII